MKKHKRLTQIIFTLILVFSITMIVSAYGVQPKDNLRIK